MNYPTGPLPHSGLGIASTVMAILGGIAMLLMFGYAYSLGAATGGQMPEDDPRVMAMGVVAIGCGALLFLGAILGVAGLFVGERRRLFSWLGMIMSGLPLLALIVVIAIGLAMAP